MMIKLIAIDMDGTLLDSQKQLPEENRLALKAAEQAGVKIVLCTGRPLVGVKPFVEQLNLAADDYVIVNNGCSTHQVNDWKLVADYRLTAQELIDLYAYQKDWPGLQLTVFDRDYYFVVADEASSLVIWDASLVFTKPTCVTLDELLIRDTAYFEAMMVGEADELDRFQAKYGSTLAKRFSTVRSQHYIFETLPQGATKASALAKLVEELGYLPENIMALGDANNDLEMLAYAGHSVAMGNSPEHVKQQARYVTASNDEAGVAQAIYRYVLQNG